VQDQQSIEGFLRDRTVKNHGARTRFSALYESYRGWAETSKSTGQACLSPGDFYTLIKNQGFVHIRGSYRRQMVTGLALK
jgi:hypothetical protein